MTNRPRPTIAHVLHRLDIAGAEVLAAELARRLSRQFRFVFICLDGGGPLAEQLSGEGFDVITFKRQPGLDVRLIRSLRSSITDHAIDLIHAHQYTPFFYTAAARLLRLGPAHPPIIFTEHGRHYPDQRKTRRVFANRLLLRCHDRVTAVGRFVKQALVNNEAIAAGRIDVIYNGVDPSRFRSGDSEQRAAVRQSLGIEPDAPLVLQVARFHPVKDHATAVRSFARVTSTNAPAHLLLAGDGATRSDIEQLTNSLGLTSRVHFLGVRTDIPHLMAAADVFLLSSESEGLCVTLLEAMAAALPIVATAVGGNGEVVVDGQTGLLSPRGCDEALATNLTAMLSDPQRSRQMGRAGSDRLLAHFTQQKMHSAYADLYQTMLAARMTPQAAVGGGRPIPRNAFNASTHRPSS